MGVLIIRALHSPTICVHIGLLILENFRSAHLQVLRAKPSVKQTAKLPPRLAHSRRFLSAVSVKKPTEARN